MSECIFQGRVFQAGQQRMKAPNRNITSTFQKPGGGQCDQRSTGKRSGGEEIRESTGSEIMKGNRMTCGETGWLGQ